jgi:hypothetical protein
MSARAPTRTDAYRRDACRFSLVRSPTVPRGVEDHRSGGITFEVHVPARARQLLTRHGWLVAIAIAYLYVFPYYPRIQSANELPRLYLVKAIVHEHSFAIDTGVKRWGSTADVSPYAGHQYSNKAPGSSFLVAPVYAVVNAVAGEPSLAFSMWLCRVVSGVVPSIAFLVLLWGFLARYAPDERVRRLVIVAYALGSMAMTFSLLYFSHQLSGICIASAWLLCIDVVERARGRRAIFAAGLLAGAGLLVDYQTAFAAVPVGIYLVVGLLRTRPPRETLSLLGLAALGATIPVAVLLWYHAQCFGSPFRTGYDASETFAHFHQQGFLGITTFRREAFWGSLFRPDNGLFVLAPWLLLAFPGAVLLWRRARATVIVALAVVVIFIAFVSSITFWRAGWSVGPRYITAMLPFMLPLIAVVLADAQARGATRTWRASAWPGLISGSILAAIAIYSLSSATFPHWPDRYANPLYEVTFRLLADGAVAPNPLRSSLGAASIIPFLALIGVLAAWAVVRAYGWRALVIGGAVAGLIIAAFSFAPRSGVQGDLAYARTVLPAARD